LTQAWKCGVYGRVKWTINHDEMSVFQELNAKIKSEKLKGLI